MTQSTLIKLPLKKTIQANRTLEELNSVAIQKELEQNTVDNQNE